MEWSCSNPDWVLTPVSDYSCMVFVRTSGQATLTATSSGCHSTATIVLNATPFGVGEGHNNGVELHPNPAKDEVTVTGQGIREVEIHNLLGQRVTQTERPEGVNCLTISLEGLPQGIYLVNVQLIDNTTISKKLIIK